MLSADDKHRVEQLADCEVEPATGFEKHLSATIGGNKIACTAKEKAWREYWQSYRGIDQRPKVDLDLEHPVPNNDKRVTPNTRDEEQVSNQDMVFGLHLGHEYVHRFHLRWGRGKVFLDADGKLKIGFTAGDRTILNQNSAEKLTPATDEHVLSLSYETKEQEFRLAHCYKCRKGLSNRKNCSCDACGWLVCPDCSSCGCEYTTGPNC